MLLSPRKFNLIFLTILYITVVLFSLGQLGRISIFGQQINAYVYEIGVVLLTLILFLKYSFKPILASRLKTIFIGFFAYLFISFLVNLFQYTLFENITSLLYFLRLFIYSTFFLYLLYHAKERSITSHIRISLWLLFGLFSITSILQYFLYTNLRNLFYLGWDPHYYRLFGVFFDTYLASAIFGLFLIFFVFSQFKNTIWNYMAGSISLLAVALTFARGAYVSIIFVFIYAAIKRKMFIPLIVCVSLLIIGYVLAPKPFGEGVNILRSSTIYSRVNDYQKAINLFKRHPFFGVGYNHIRYAKGEIEQPTDQFDVSHAGASFHSSFMIMLVCGGIFGLILYILFLFKIAELNMFAQYGMIFMVFFSFTDNVLLHPFVLFLFFLSTAAYPFKED